MSERIEILQINQPRCENVFGQSPCTATGTQCFNTLATCKDLPNFVESGEPLELYIHTECENPFLRPGMFPSLLGVDRQPGVLNIGSADPDKRPLGVREVVKFTIQDHPYHDRYTDPYARQRSYNPMSQGTFWGKWLARNDNYEGMECIYRVGKIGDALVDMTSLHLQIERIDGPGSDGVVLIECSDILRRADDNRATIPSRARGVLSAELNSSDTSFTVSATSDDLDVYPASGFLTINNEKMSYTLTGNLCTVVRGFGGTDAVEHDEGSTVQFAQVVSGRVDVILIDWLLNNVGVPAGWIDVSEWQEEVDTWLPTYIFDTIIWKPLGANETIGQFLRDSSAYIIPDLENKRLRLRAIRPTELTKSVTEDDNIVLGSFQVVRKPEIRLTQLWLNYAMRDTLGSDSDRSNFSKLRVRFSDDIEQSKTQKIKEIFSRFIGAGNPSEAELTIRRIMERYQGRQEEYVFALEADDAKDLGLGDVCVIDHREIQDEFGDRRPATAQVISVKQSNRGSIVQYKAQPFKFGFATTVWADETIPDWDDASAAEKAEFLYWSDADGLIDGEEVSTWA
jgi:hypothetical protein